MQIHIIASGSTGNSIFIELGEKKILVDAGISARRIERGLAEVGITIKEIDGVLITHEHQDHIKGLDVLIRRHKLPVYARPGTWDRIPFRDRLPRECCRDLGDQLDLGALKIESFAISHDAADPVGFCFYYKNIKCALVTDLGMVTPAVQEALAYTDMAVLEANHDLDMLNKGPYPQFLKQRIRGITGHLSNLDAAHLLAGIARKKVMQVFLAHLSQQNNHPDLAENTISSVLQSKGCDVGREIVLNRTYPNYISSLKF